MTLGVVLGVVFALGWVPLFVFRAEAVTQALPSYTASERFWVTVAPAALALHVTGICVAVSLASNISWWSAGLALVLFGSAIVFWFWGRAMIGPLRLRRLPDDPPLRLQRGGAFGVVRHPLYCAYLLAAVAPLAVVPRPCFAFTFAACCVALGVRAVQEEQRLHAQLGAPYAAYCQTVKRLIPFVW